jgi:hypothetical protein
MSLSSDIQKVYICNIETNYVKNESANGNTRSQTIHTAESPSTILSFDTLNSVPGSDNYALIYPNLHQTPTTLKLVSMSFNLNIETINKYNDTLIIDWVTTSGVARNGQITLTLAHGYYTDLDDFVAELNAVSTSFFTATAPALFDAPLLFTRGVPGSNLNSADFQRIVLDFPNGAGINAAQSVAFTTNANCGFVKYGKNMSYFTPKISTENGQTLISSIAHLQYTRYLLLNSEELTVKHQSSYINREQSNLIGVVALSNISTPISATLQDTSGYTIDVKNVNLSLITISLFDEYENPWPVGYNYNGELLDNQVRLTYLARE